MEKRERQANVTLFKSQKGNTKLHGHFEALHDIPKGTKLSLQIYEEVSKAGNAYLSGPAYIDKPRESIID